MEMDMESVWQDVILSHAVDLCSFKQDNEPGKLGFVRLPLPLARPVSNGYLLHLVPTMHVARCTC